MIQSHRVATAEWYRTLELIQKQGSATEQKSRGLRCLEILNHTSKIDMKYPLINCPPRKLGRRFQYAEAAWILSGDNKVSTISKYAPAIVEFSDDGVYFQGAYGPSVVTQLNYILQTLLDDTQTRQAVLTIWNRNPRPSKDIPCTLSLQFIIRDDKLHVVANMRSSDIWLGWPYDVFNFTMIAAYISIEYNRCSSKKLALGTLYLNAASQHLYLRDLDNSVECIKFLDDNLTLSVPSNYPPFKRGGDLIEWLWSKANE